jgi:hypothetical protein
MSFKVVLEVQRRIKTFWTNKRRCSKWNLEERIISREGNLCLIIKQTRFSHCCNLQPNNHHRLKVIIH